MYDTMPKCNVCSVAQSDLAASEEAMLLSDWSLSYLNWPLGWVAQFSSQEFAENMFLELIELPHFVRDA